MTRFVALILASLVFSTGCAAAPAMRPVEARSRLLANPEIGRWYAEHSAPAVLGGMSPREARRWRKYQPAVTFDVAKEGYSVKLEARFGPAPRQLIFLMDPGTGAIRPR